MTMVDPPDTARDEHSVASEVAGGPSPRRARMLTFAFLTATGIVLLDQGSKWLALTWLSQTERLPLLGDLIGMQLAFNPGAALSLGSGVTWLYTAVGVVAMVALPLMATRVQTGGLAIALGLIWGGAAGNLVDRLFAPPGFGRGHVTDFLAYGDLFIGNLADVALAVGIAAAAVLRWRSDRRRSQ